jgi:drug/metabolite transporter (DMT)-like permease
MTTRLKRSTPASLSWPGAPLAIVSAVLFGASTPFAKLLLGGGANPWLLAGLLYLGSGVGLSLVHIARRFTGIGPVEASLKRADLLWLSLVVLSGGVLGPVLLMIGLSTTPASSASLLLNLEGLATMAIAWIVFRENVDRRLLVGALAILAGAVLISGQGWSRGVGVGALAIAGACLAWGIDNNLTRKLSGSDPVQIALIKGVAAGAVNLTLALLFGARLPALGPLAGAAIVGFLGYGVSLVMFVLGLRFLGAARTGAYFSAAPFIGAVLSLSMFHEPLTARLVAAGGLMGLGLYLHLSESHSHTHEHRSLDHEHSHIHDEHHQHPHGPCDASGEPHSHRHRHAPMRHKHPHYPDLHHRHDHEARMSYGDGAAAPPNPKSSRRGILR